MSVKKNLRIFTAFAMIVASSGIGIRSAHADACGPQLSGLVSWWKAEGNANDWVGGNNGTIYGTVGFVPGMAGQAFSFAGGRMIM